MSTMVIAMRKNKQDIKNQILLKAYKDPKFKGKEVVTISQELHVLNTKDRGARAKLLISLAKKYPRSVPIITFIPKDDTLILFF